MKWDGEKSCFSPRSMRRTAHISCFFPLLLLVFLWWPSHLLAATRLLMNIFTAINWILTSDKCFMVKPSCLDPPSDLKVQDTRHEISHYQSEGNPSHWPKGPSWAACQPPMWRPGPPPLPETWEVLLWLLWRWECQEGAITSNYALARLGPWAMLLSWQWAPGHVTACFSLASVLTCSIPMAASKRRGFCGHGMCQSCTASTQPQRGHSTSWLPPFNFCSSGFPVWMSSAQTCSRVMSCCLCQSGESQYWKTSLLAILKGLNIGTFELSVALAEQIDFLTSHSRPAFPLY